MRRTFGGRTRRSSMGTLHSAEAGGQHRRLMVCRPPSVVRRLFSDLRPDPLEAFAHVRRPVGPVVLPGPFVVHEWNALLSGLPLERAVLLPEPVPRAPTRE